MPRRFGVEIEFEGDMARLLQALRQEGLQVQDSRTTHDTGDAPYAWCVKRDGTVQVGGELVSPPLDFDDPDQRGQVDRAVRALQNAGCNPYETAGIHVHVEARNEDGTDFTGKQIAAVVRFCYKFEDAIYRIASSGWETIRRGARNYARPLDEHTAQAIMKARTHDEVQGVWDGQFPNNPFRVHHDRYTAVNLRSYWRRGTIEFRYFNSSVNPDRIQVYIALCMAIMQDARNGHSRSVKKSYPLGSMHSGRVSENALFLRLQQVLRTESGDTSILMSTEDWKNLRRICWKGSRPQQAFAARRR